MRAAKGTRGLHFLSSVGARWDKHGVCRCKKENIISSELWALQSKPCLAGQDPELPGGSVQCSLRWWICCQKMGTGVNICR